MDCSGNRGDSCAYCVVLERERVWCGLLLIPWAEALYPSAFQMREGQTSRNPLKIYG